MKPDEKALRDQLVSFLTGAHAHATVLDTVKDFPMDKINTKAPNSTYTPWRLLEHIRITQWDVLNFVQNPQYEEMKWPDEYWPKAGVKATPAMWKKTLADFKKDLNAFVTIVQNPKTDLYNKIPHGDGQTILREALLIIDHNSFHLGEFSILREVMKTWGKNTKRP